MGNTKMEDFFNLPPSEVTEKEHVKTKAEQAEESITMFSAVSMAEKINFALPTVIGLDMHESEMDDIAAKALKSYEDLNALGNNVPDMHAGKIYEVSAQFLKTALDAKIAKADKKLRMIELQLKKVRAEQIDFELGNGQSVGGGNEFDRAEIIKYIVGSKISTELDK